MTAFDPEVFGERLRKEMAERGLDVKALHEAVARLTNNGRGTSYGSVWSYVNGQASPSGPREVVVAALAEALGVLPEYLLGGGPRTREEAALRERIVTILEEHKPTLFELLQDKIPELGQLELMVTFALTDFLLGAAIFSEEHSGRTLSEGELLELGKKVYEWATEPRYFVAELAGREIESVCFRRGALSDSIVLAIQSMRAAFRDVSIPPQQGETNA